LYGKREETALILSQKSGRNLRHIRKAFHPRGPAGGRCGTRNDGPGIGSFVSACRLRCLTLWHAADSCLFAQIHPADRGGDARSELLHEVPRVDEWFLGRDVACAKRCGSRTGRAVRAPIAVGLARRGRSCEHRWTTQTIGRGRSRFCPGK
jgi:hypothetical protein